MGLFSGVASLLRLNLDAASKAEISSEIDLSRAVESHIRWKLRLRNYLDGKSDEQLDPSVICRDDQCELGKWIHGAGMNHFHDLPPFHELRSDHAEFHQIAGKVVRHAQSNEHPRAETLLREDYARVSHKVVMALTELNKAVSE